MPFALTQPYSSIAAPDASSASSSDFARTDPYIQFERLLTDATRRLYALEDACAQDQLTPTQIELDLVRLTAEEMRARLAQAQVLAEADKARMTPGLCMALNELAEHANHIADQVAGLEQQRQLDKLTSRQRRIALARATAAHTRLHTTHVRLELMLARGTDQSADAATHLTPPEWAQQILAAGETLMAHSRQRLAALRQYEGAAGMPLAVPDSHTTIAPPDAASPLYTTASDAAVPPAEPVPGAMSNGHHSNQHPDLQTLPGTVAPPAAALPIKPALSGPSANSGKQHKPDKKDKKKKAKARRKR
jgi:hypothetical protein